MSLRQAMSVLWMLITAVVPAGAAAERPGYYPPTEGDGSQLSDLQLPDAPPPPYYDPNMPTIQLSLADAILYARIYNFGLAAAQVGAAISALEPDIQSGIFDETLRASASYNVRRRGGISFQSQIAGGTLSENATLALEAIKPTQTGGQFSLGYTTDRSDNTSSSTGGEEESPATYSSNTELRYTQPLLEGFGRRRTRSPITQAEISAAINAAQVYQRSLNIEQTVTDQYLAILRAGRQLDVAENSLGVAEAIFEQTEAQVEAGALARFEITNAEGGLATRQEGILLATQRLENATDSLKQTLGLPLDTPITLVDEVNVALVEGLTEDEAYDVALDTRPEVEIFELREEAAKDQLLNAEDALQNDLNINASAGVSGEGLGYGESLKEMDKFSWSLGLEYLIPLGKDHRAEGQHRQAELALDQLALERQETLTQIANGISQSIRNLNIAGQRLDITATGVRVAEQRLENERARLNLGLSTTTLVLDVEEDLANARLRQIEAELDFAQAKATLLQELGFSQLQAPPVPITLPPVPPPPAPFDAAEGDAEGVQP